MTAIGNKLVIIGSIFRILLNDVIIGIKRAVKTLQLPQKLFFHWNTTIIIQYLMYDISYEVGHNAKLQI